MSKYCFFYEKYLHKFDNNIDNCDIMVSIDVLMIENENINEEVVTILKK